jgi:arabinose-5-phosphate isomerase
MIIERAKKVLEIEAEAIYNLIPRLDTNFEKAVGIIFSCRGRVIVTGMGKSGLVGRKIAATLASTGTPAFYLHPAEGLHGDLGMIMKDDCLLAISYSGETTELAQILPLVKKMGLKLITMTGNRKSRLAKFSDVVLDIQVNREACPYNLAPTASTTACLALGDSLAISLLEKRKLKKEDFAYFHPAGTIGKKLFLQVKDIMRSGEDNPLIFENETVKDALFVMTEKGLGAVNVVDKNGKLVGYFTDGDLRRGLQSDGNLLKKRISLVMTKKPLVTTPDKLAVEAARLLKEKSCDNLPVVDKKGKVIGIIDEGDLLAEGIV